MKIRTIIHEPTETVKERKNDISKESFLKDSIYHPFMLEREYVRSLNYTKLERLLSKPFVAALSWHPEGIYSLKRDGDRFMTASFDGTVIVWNMAERDMVLRRKFEFTPVISFCQSDMLIGGNGVLTRHRCDETLTPIIKYKTEKQINFVDYAHEQIFTTTKDGCLIYDPERITYKQKYGDEEFLCAKYSNVLQHILGCAGRQDVVLVDDRARCEFARFKSGIRTMDLCFNPVNGSYLATANEDSNCYLYDMRYLGDNPKPIRRWINHVNSVVSIDYRSNGTEITTGSFDKTVRIYNETGCKDVYYSKRMGNVNGVKYSEDGKFIISASDDGSIRLWRSDGSERSGPKDRREEEAIKYASAVRDKFADLPEIRRISKHRFLPKKLKNDIRRECEKHQASIRKKERIKQNNKKKQTTI
ncbi:DDB1- and CUL4-associated factor 13 [Astathelohania contejeani]|uniref:DDB1- and CUL4-associated factor 13 n=1 Tax=Astathelohania contejeani TaxID=164912 RepID=A0ABQ7HZP2_9MICR|nr:DDB1- and CUL4-associated factor 13 [Thelohania contejeani]